MSIRGVWGVEDFPIKKQFHTPVAIHLLERSEVYKQIKKSKFSLCRIPLSGWVAWEKKRKKWLCVSGLFRIMPGRLGDSMRNEYFAKPELCEVASAVFMA